MKERDLHDALMSVTAVVGDAAAVLAGAFLAVWTRFDSGWFSLPFGRDPHLYAKYGRAILVVLPIYLGVGYVLELYSRPQQGTFGNKIPRLVRSTGMTTLCVLILNSLVKNYVEFSNGAILLSFPLITAFVCAERWLLFKLEPLWARRVGPIRAVLILGGDATAARLRAALDGDERMRTRVIGLASLDDAPPDPRIPAALRLGNFREIDFDRFLEKHPETDHVILTTPHLLSHEDILGLIVLCEKHMLRFDMVPDLFRVLTFGMEMSMIEEIPLLGVGAWPLDRFWNRAMKRMEDLFGAFVGLLVSAPVMLLLAMLIRKSSPGPVLYRQERCGLRGKRFVLYKLRTMRPDAEEGTGPVFTRPDDPRTTPLGAWMRRYNLDELPQLWNVLIGDMSLVGPRPERPFFVERFREDIERYMWRHASRPGMTGWAQVNGLRGDTSIRERIKYDLYYLENWSLALDFKILARTFRARRNAY